MIGGGHHGKTKRARISLSQKHLMLWGFLCIVIGKFAPAIPTALGNNVLFHAVSW
jgi:hypothetical protein